MLVGVDDARSVTIPPEVPCPAHCPVVTKGDPGVEVLHGTVEVLFGCGGDYVVVVRHQDDMVNKKVIFFNGFLQCLEEDPGDLPLFEPEGPVVGSADQMIGIDVLDYSQWTSHASRNATFLPKGSDTLTVDTLTV